jgi:hypothetical protein
MEIGEPAHGSQLRRQLTYMDGFIPPPNTITVKAGKFVENTTLVTLVTPSKH